MIYIKKKDKKTLTHSVKRERERAREDGCQVAAKGRVSPSK
jgi:hypothetical protein